MPAVHSLPFIAHVPDAGHGAVATDSPIFDMTDFFAGAVTGTGVFHDRFGNLRLSFDVTMAGQWVGPIYNLDEDFRYDDGRTQHRLWQVRRAGGDGLTATADDIVGTAKAKQLTNEIRWAYRMRVPVGARILTMTFDDRMYLRPDGSLLNVSQASKFGIQVGRLTAVYRRI